MPVGAAPTLESLLSRGYLPKELPPCFSTATFTIDTKVASDKLSALKVPWTASCSYNLVRPGGARRVLQIPNPLAYLRLAQQVVAQWPKCDEVFAASTLAATRPVAGGEGERAVRAQFPISELFERRLNHRAEAGYLLKADILACYSSIYTHSIPWALLGKSAAKAPAVRHDPKLPANVLDAAVRGTRNGQTKGIDIGPDASFVIAELVLSACDRELREAIPGVRGFRRYDDYELYFEEREKAETGLDRLQRVLGHFELVLNPRKTAIVQLPAPLDYDWALDLKRYDLRTGATQRDELVRVFEHAFRLMRSGVDEHVMGYVLGRTQKRKILEDNWRVYERLLWQATLIEPAVLPTVMREVLKYRKKRPGSVDEALAARVLNRHVRRNAHQGNSHEVAWALWGLQALKKTLEASPTAAVCEMEDPVVALLALRAKEKGLVDGAFTSAVWEPYAEAGALEGPFWILTYEAGRRGWTLGSKGRAPDWPEGYRVLENAGVRFLVDRFGPGKGGDDDDYQQYWQGQADEDGDQDGDDVEDDTDGGD